MRVKVYPEGDGESENEFGLAPAEAVKAYIGANNDGEGDGDVTNLCVEPLDDEARALLGWHAPDEPGGLPFKMFRAKAHVVVTWSVEEVATFRTDTKGDG